MADIYKPLAIWYEESPTPYAISPSPALKKVDKAKSDRLIERYKKYIASDPSDARKDEATLSLIRKLLKMGWIWSSSETIAPNNQLMNVATLSIPGVDHDSHTTKQPSPNSSSSPRVPNSCPTTGDINWSTAAT